jgi:hypothetical protein
MHFLPVHRDARRSLDAKAGHACVNGQDDQTNPAIDHDLFTDPATQY